MFLVAVSVDLSRLITLLPRLALHFAGCLSGRSKHSPAGKHMERGSADAMFVCGDSMFPLQGASEGDGQRAGC